MKGSGIYFPDPSFLLMSIITFKSPESATQDSPPVRNNLEALSLNVEIDKRIRAVTPRIPIAVKSTLFNVDVFFILSFSSRFVVA